MNFFFFFYNQRFNFKFKLIKNIILKKSILGINKEKMIYF
jgi:hypothetical protein